MRHIHHTYFHLTRMSEKGRVVWSHLLSNFGAALVTIFVPIFLLRLGYPLTDVLLYLALQGLFSIPLQILFARLFSVIRANHAMALGLLLQVVFLLLLMSLETTGWPLWLIALTWAASRSLYWVSFHINFSKSRNRQREGREVSTISVLKIVASGVAPAIGGILATMLGINFVYGITIGLLTVAIVALLRGEEISSQRPYNPRSLDYRKIRRDLFASFSNATTTVGEFIIWPIMVSLLIPSYAGIGLLASVVMISAIAASLYVGRREERRGRRHYLKEGALITSISDVLRLFAENAGHVLGINLFGGVGNSLYYTPYLTKYYDHADEEPRLEYLTAMETAHEIGWASFFLVLFGLSFLLSDTAVLLAGIAIAAPFNFGIRAIR